MSMTTLLYLLFSFGVLAILGYGMWATMQAMDGDDD